MAGEVTVPLLPCVSIDEIMSFYEALGNLSGFSVVAPGGNWIRILPTGGSVSASSGRLAKVLDNAVVLGDSKNDPQQAAKILDGALSRDAPAAERVEALAYRVELTVRLGEEERAASLLAELVGCR